MHITSQDLQTYAARRLAALRKRGATYVAQAQDRVGDVRNLTLASLVDKLGDEAAEVARVTCDLCGEAGDSVGQRAIDADLHGTSETLHRHAIDCRMAALQPWPPATQAVHERVTQ